MNWIQTIIHKITNYDTVVKENNSLRTKEAEVEKQLGNVLEQLTTINNKYSLLKEELQKLTSKKILNINKLKNYYEGKRIPEAWVYNGGRLGSKDVKYYLRIATKDQPVIVKASKTLIKKYHPKTSQEIVASLLKYFSSTRQWTYVYDKEQFGKNDYWQVANKSWETRVGDCDDLAILMNGLYEETCNQLGLQDDVWRLTFTAGTLNTGGGHAYNTYLADDGEYYAVESTFDIKGSYHRTWLKTPIKNNNFYSKFWGFATKKQSWKGNLEALQIEINEE